VGERGEESDGMGEKSTMHVGKLSAEREREAGT